MKGFEFYRVENKYVETWVAINFHGKPNDFQLLRREHATQKNFDQYLQFFSVTPSEEENYWQPLRSQKHHFNRGIKELKDGDP